MPEDNQQTNNQNQNSDITLEKLQADLDLAMNGWKRAAADFENFKKQKERENKELLEFAKEITVVKLLPIIDSLEQALRHAPEVNHELGIMNQVSLTPAPLPEGEGAPSDSRGAGEKGPPSDFLKKYENWLTGINGILAQLDKALGELGVKKIEAIGEKFDPHFHEAIREIESDEDDGMVVEELQSGFILNGKVIRPSQVAISKKAAKGGE